MMMKEEGCEMVVLFSEAFKSPYKEETLLLSLDLKCWLRKQIGMRGCFLATGIKIGSPIMSESC